jgi:hypothetical protein
MRRGGGNTRAPRRGSRDAGTDGIRVARAYGSRTLPGDGWLSRNVVGEIISPAMPLRGYGKWVRSSLNLAGCLMSYEKSSLWQRPLRGLESYVLEVGRKRVGLESSYAGLARGVKVVPQWLP